MNWIIVFLLFDATTGELKNHNTQQVANQKVCEESGIARTNDVAFDQPGYKLSYVCLAPEAYEVPKDPKAEKKKKAWIF